MIQRRHRRHRWHVNRREKTILFEQSENPRIARSVKPVVGSVGMPEPNEIKVAWRGIRLFERGRTVDMAVAVLVILVVVTRRITQHTGVVRRRFHRTGVSHLDEPTAPAAISPALDTLGVHDASSFFDALHSVSQAADAAMYSGLLLECGINFLPRTTMKSDEIVEHLGFLGRKRDAVGCAHVARR